jgi:hypothetical protein
MNRFLLPLFGLLLVTARTATKERGAVDLTKLPPNTWVAIKPIIEQPDDESEKGRWMNVGWNKLVYDPTGKRVLYYDRWFDQKHGGYTIYGNCLFAFDPASAKLTPITIDHWARVAAEKGGYRTKALPENDKVPTPCSRHVYHGFEYVPELNAVFLCNGANQGAISLQGELLGHQLCSDTWFFDLARKQWTRLASREHPPNRLEDGMAWCPATKTMVYVGHGKIWLLDPPSGQWRQAKNHLPRDHMGMTVFYDPPRQRMLLVGGGTYNKWQTKAGGFNTCYAFDPRAETVTKLADCPTALCRGALAYDRKRDRFLTAVALKGKGVEQPSGMFAYEPKSDTWHSIEPTNPMPMANGWMPVCYDAVHDCLIGMVETTFYAFRYQAAK